MDGVWCFVFCFGVTTPLPAPTVLDSYCQSYQRVVLSTAELEQVKKLDRKLRDRIQGNDLDYLCRCKGWSQDPKKQAACVGAK
jgi:hypothetical protein